MADKYGYEPITSAPVPTAEEIARRNIARSRQEAARKEEAEKRRLALIAEAKRQAAQKKRPASDENEDRPRSRPSTFSTVPDAITESDIPPKTVKVDDVEMPLDQAVAKIPEQMAFEDFVLASPLKERALARARTEELTASGMAPEKAAEQARQEREARQAAFERGREAVRKEPATADKEGRGFAESVTSGVGAPIARMLGFGQAANEAEARAAGVQAELSQFRDERYAHPQIAGAVAGAAQNTAQMGPGIAASMLGGPAVGMAVMSGQFGSQEYSRAAYEGAEAGLAGAELNRYALIQGGIEASIMPIMSKIPGMAGIEGRVLRQNVARGVAAHPTIRKALSGAGTLAKDTAAEVTEEVITEVLHGFASEGMLNEDVDYKAVIGDTVLQTLVMMGMTEGVTQAGRLMDSGRQVQPELTQPDQQIQQYETPVLKNPAIDAFIANPGSAKLYEAAVASGMAPLPNPNRTERRKYAAGLKQLSRDPAPQPALQNEASSAEMPPAVETPSGMVPDRFDDWLKSFSGDPNGQEADVAQAQSNRENERADEKGRQEREQGRQEGLLTVPQETPSGTEGMTAAASPNDSAVSPAITREDFEKEYRDTFREWMKYPPDQAGHTVYRDKMADLYDAHPDWADEIENTLPKPDQPTPPELASGELSPVQSSPSLAGPVSTQEATPVATGVPSPDQSSKEAGPVSETPKRYPSALKRYPAKIPDPYNEPGRPQREFDAPPVYLTGVSNAASREAAKTMPNLGVMITPRTQQYRTHIDDYQFFGVDNGAFTGKFNEKGFYKLLDNIREQGAADKALFATAPDVVGDWEATLKASEPHLDRIRDAGFPVAIVLQNGATVETVPWDRIDALFVGGDDNFKLAQKDSSGRLDRDSTLIPIMREAKKRDVPVHFGRVNSAKRLEMVHYGLSGRSVDGTFIKFGNADEQTNKVMSWLKPWGKFPDKKPQESAPGADVSGRDRILAAVKQVNPRVQSGDMVSIADLRAAVGMEPAEFDATMQQLVKDKVLAAHRFDRPGMVSDEQKQQMLKLGDAYHNTVSLWENEPGDRDRINQMMDDAEAKKPKKDLGFTPPGNSNLSDEVEAAIESGKIKMGNNVDLGQYFPSKRLQDSIIVNGPFPDEKYMDKLTKEHVSSVKLDDLISDEMQTTVNEDVVNYYKEKESTEPIIVHATKIPGKFRIHEGRHRAVAAKLKGKKSIPAYVFNQELIDRLEAPTETAEKPLSQEDLMEQILREELLGEKPKKERKPRTPKTDTGEPKAPRKPRTEAAKKRTKDTAKQLKAAADEFRKQFGKPTARGGFVPVLTKEQMRASAQLVKAALDHGVSKFNEFVAYVVDEFGSDIALQAADGIELAWRTLKRLPEYSGIDEAGKVADVINQKTEAPAETQSEQDAPAVATQPPALALVEFLEEELLKSRGIDAKRLWELADKAYGGTRAEGKYGPSEAYDALETAINLTILDARAMGLKTPAGQVSPEVALKNLLDMQKQIVSQTNRSGTKDTMQQFSTPPAYSYVVSQFVNMDARDVVLEPSAGTGDLAVHALNQRAKVHVNELDPKRAEMLKAVQASAEDRLTISTEDALQLGNIMGPNLRPSVVLMNPPFSREGQRMGDKKMSGNDRNHIDAAMASLIDGGRLVAIIGAGLHGPSKGFTTWLAETAKKHNVRANIEVSRDVYKGYGTTFPTRVLVIDKGTPTPKDGTLTAQADSLEHLLTMTKGIRNDRNRGAIQPVSPGQNVPGNVGTTEGGQQPKAPERAGATADNSGKPYGGSAGPTAKAPRRTPGAADTTAADDTGGRSDTADSKGTGSNTPAGSESAGGGTTDAAGEPTGNLAGQSPQPRRVGEKRTEIDDSVLFEPYQPSIVPFPNAKPHPTAAVESAAMSAVDYPEVTEVPNIDASIIEDGRLSDVQLEFVALAAHAHNQLLPSDERTGILFGDGTGMGKGRGIPGVILHNWNEGRRQAIWMSKNGKLHSDAMREWEELGGNPAQVANLSDMPVDNAIDLKEGILFATYDTLKSRGKSGKTRAQQVIDWLPKDFEGVIAFDEAHLMGSDTAARAGVARDIQDKFPKARVVYASATAATEIDQLMFGSRLGLWGAATPFATAKEFAAKIGSAGVSAMESVALSLKAMGRYVSRSISFNDGTPDGTVGYRRLNHPLAEHQVQMYDRLAEAWQKVIGEFEDAMDATGADNFARGFARGQFWSAHQRFFNDLVTSLQMPTVIESIEKDLAEGRSVVIQLTTTGAAQQARALAGRGTQSLDDFAVDPFSSLVELVRSQFPTQAYEEYVKDDGSVGRRPVVDSAGKPVKDAAAVAAQQQLLSDLAEMESSMPDSPLDMILNYFGIENVAEVTGRNQRVIWQEQPDGTKKRVLEKRSQKKSNQADIDAFQEGKKRILVFSQAGGTGASYHADRRASNQQKRVHYLVQPGWVAADAIQGLGRTHRTNQRQAPEYILVQTDIPGQKRFISTIARRLTQLGALTRGQRTAGGGGVFEATDNLESTEASLALTEFFKSLENEDSVMSLEEFEEQTGLELRLRSTGAMKSDVNLPDITSFMNRMLSMKIESQNKVFDQFDRLLQSITEARRISGELDQGVETIKGGNIRKTRDEVVFTHDSGAKTRYVQLMMDIPVPSRDFETQAKSERFTDFIGYYKRKSNGRVFFVNESFAKTTSNGRVVDMVRLVPPYGETLREEAYTLSQGKLEKITRAEAESLWNEQYGNRPKTKPHTVDMITGAVLPVWDRLPQLQPKLSRALTAAGDMVLGVVLPPSKVNETLGKLGAEKNKVDVGTTIKMLRTGKGDVQLVNGWTIQRVRVQNEWRLEIIGPNPVIEQVFQRQGVIIERIGFRARYFIPFGENTQAVFEAVTRGNPVQKVNRYDAMDTGDDEEVDNEEPETVEQPEENSPSPPPEATPERQALEKAKQELRELQILKTQHDNVILKEWKRVLRSDGPAAMLLPLTDEMARNIVGRIVVTVKSGVKQFEVLVRELKLKLGEEVVRGVKPNLMRAWNTMREVEGLDEATDSAFDAGMADNTDSVIEQAIEAAKGETPEEMPEGERLYSTKNAFSAVAREELGMGERPPVPTLEREPSIEMAKAYGQTKAGSDYIDTLIQELTAQPRAVTPYENDLLNYRNAELGEKLDTALRSQIAARKSGDSIQEAIAQTQAGNLRTAKQALIELVLEPIGTEAGRALQARKAVINQDFTLERLAMEYEAAYGKPPSPEQLEAMQKQIDDLKAGQAELQKLLDEANAKNDDLETRLKEAHDSAVAAEKTPAPPAAPKQTILQAMGERGRNRINSAKKRIMEMLREGKSFSIGGVVDEAGKAFLELATGYTEIGIVTVADFLKQLRRDFGPSFDKVKDPALAAFNQVRTSGTTDELDSITSRIDILDPDTIGKAARNLHSFVIRRDGLDASAAGREAAVDAVHQILADFVPGITPEEVARAMSGIGIYSELSKDEAEIVRRDQKAQLLSLQQIADWKKGEAPPRTGPERPPISDEQRMLRRAVNEAKKAAGIVEATAGQLRSALDAAKRMARNRITDLTKAIESGQRIAVSRKLLQPDAELTALQAERDALQQLYDEAFGKRELSDEQKIARAEKALDRAIADLEADLKAGKLYPDAPGPQVTSPAIEAKREILDALKASRDELRLQSGEAQARSDAAYERMLMERGARLAQKIADEDFAPPAKKPERELTPAMLKQMLANQKMQQKIQSERRKWEFDNKHIVYKAMTWGPVATAAIIRKGLTTIDQSLIGRQGYLLGITHPEIYGKAIRKAFASNPLAAKSLFPTEQDLFDTQTALDADARWVRLEKIAKLAVTDVHGGLNREEDSQFVPEWVNKIPGVGGSERAGSAFINTQRRLVFRSLVDKLSKTMDGKNKTISNADLRVIGNLVNVASGRGNIGTWSAAIKGMSSVFFSPSWWASRLAWWAGQPVWQDARWTGGEGASTEVRMMAAMEWGKQAAAQAAIMGIVSAGLFAAFGAPGDDEEWDFYVNPISPNFGKIRVGNTMIDMTAGLGQHLSYFARILTGKQSDRWEMNEISRIRLALTYGRGKLAPIPASVVDFLVGSDMDRQEFGSGKWVANKVLPLMVQDVMDASEKEGLPMAPVISALMFFGVGAQSYDERVKERKDTANEVRALQKQGKPQSEIDALLNKHFASQAAKEAKEALRTAEPEETARLETIAAETDSPELTEAIQKEKGDLVLVASVMLSTEDKTKDKKSPDEDKSITTARDLLKAVAPTYEDAAKLYTEAYKRRNGSITELVGPKGKKRYVVKKNVIAARRRLKAMYATP